MPIDSPGDPHRNAQRGGRQRVTRLTRGAMPRASSTRKAAGQETGRLRDVLVTHKLKARRRRKANTQAENAALQELARMLAATPEALVDRLLRAALELCSAGSAGLSLLEITEPGEQIFRWTNVAGVLSGHVGDSTPRDFSPCGATMDADGPQLFANPERHFAYMHGLQYPLIECLTTPVAMEGEILGTLWIATHDETVKFDAEDARILSGLAEFTVCALRMTRMEELRRTARLRLEREMEVSKRTENALRETQALMEVDMAARAAQLEQLSARLLNLQDEERRRLARELHDSAGQYLAGIQMNLGALLRPTSGIDDSARARVADSMEMAGLCTTEIRTMSYLLHPPLLDETGLRSALSWYVDGFAERSGIRVTLELPEGLGRLPSEIETALFRVVQQSLANIHRHSGSAVAKIRMEMDAEMVSVEIADEGRGIAQEVLAGFYSGTRLIGVGMAGMRERIRDMGGKFEVRSSNKGAAIAVQLKLGASALSAGG